MARRVSAIVWAKRDGIRWLTKSVSRYGHSLAPSRFTCLPADSVPGVTIIRPLCGLDTNLYNTLESVMRLDYPKYEVIFALQSKTDEALGVVEMLMNKFPHVDAKVVVSEPPKSECIKTRADVQPQTAKRSVSTQR